MKVLSGSQAALLKQPNASHTISTTRHTPQQENKRQPRESKKPAQLQAITLEQRAALAIASNQAQSRMAALLGFTEVKHYIAWLTTGDLHTSYASLRALYHHDKAQQRDASINKAPPPISDEVASAQAKLDTAWSILHLRLRDDQGRYYSAAERHLIAATALRRLDALRNHYSHIPQTENAQGPLDCRQLGSFCSWLNNLYTEAIVSQDLLKAEPILTLPAQPPNDTDKHPNQLTEPLGVSFFLNLFLPRSQAMRLLQALFPKQRRRFLHAMSHYSVRDGISSLSQPDQDNELIREIIGYLCLPPLDSAEGQRRLTQLQQRDPSQPQVTAYSADDQPNFRRQPKTRAYTLQILDRLGRLPYLQFWGWEEHNLGTPDAPLWQAKTQNIASKDLAQTRSLSQKQGSYGRNTPQSAQYNTRFCYDQRDGNLRFALTPPTNNHDTPPRYGVVRWRDFMNWVYFILIENKHETTLHQAVWNNLASRQDFLKNSPADATQLPAHLHRQLPRQVQQQLTGNTPSLATRLSTRLNFWERRLDRLDAEFAPNQRHAAATAKARANDRHPPKAGKDLMPIHKQVHEILHYALAVSNAAERASFSRHRFRELYTLLLRYKTEVEQQAFWQKFVDYFTTEHPFYQLKLPANQNPKRPHACRDRHALMERVLQKRREQFNTDKRALPQAGLTAQQQMAPRWGLSLQDQADPPQTKEGAALTLTPPNPSNQRGAAAAAQRTLAYTVLPAGFFQQTLEGNTQAQRNTDPQAQRTQPVGSNIAQRIRNRPQGLRLIAKYYDIQQHPTWQTYAETLKRTKSLSQTFANDAAKKAAFRQLTGTLNDWHTEDRFCLLLTELLMQKNQLFSPNASNQSVLTVFDTNQNACSRTLPAQQGQSAITITFQHPLHSKRQWAVWGTDKLRKALQHNYPNQSIFTAETLAGLISQYETRYRKISTELLRLETSCQRAGWLKQAHWKDGEHGKWLPFSALVACLVERKHLDNHQAEALKTLRNHALHDGIPNDKTLYGQPQANALAVTTLGETLLQTVKEISAKAKKTQQS